MLKFRNRTFYVAGFVSIIMLLVSCSVIVLLPWNDRSVVAMLFSFLMFSCCNGFTGISFAVLGCSDLCRKVLKGHITCHEIVCSKWVCCDDLGSGSMSPKEFSVPGEDLGLSIYWVFFWVINLLQLYSPTPF